MGVWYLDKINDYPRLNAFGTSRGMKCNRFSSEHSQKNGKLLRNSMIKFNILVKLRGTKSIHDKESG